MLIVGAAHAPSVIDTLAVLGAKTRITVVDDDAEALRALKTRVQSNRSRLKLVRKKTSDLAPSLLNTDFDGVIIHKPTEVHELVNKTARSDPGFTGAQTPISILSYPISADEWW